MLKQPRVGLLPVLIAFACIAASAQPPATTTVLASYGKIGMKFEAAGDRRAPAFVSRGAGYRVSVTAAGAAIDVSRPADAERSLLQMRFAGAGSRPSPEGLDLERSHTNYLIGKNPAAWRTNVAQYGKVLCREVYPGIDVVYYGNQRQLEYDLVIAPGADPRAIQLSFDGARHLRITPEGDLAIQMAAREVRLRAPKIFQEFDGGKRRIAGSYVLKGRAGAGFEIGNYDRGRRLIVDPVLSYSTYTGGTGDDVAFAVAADSAGNAYITGTTTSTNLPTTTGAFQKNKSGGNFDVFVAKLNPAGTALVYATYIGGGGDEEAYGIAVDGAGNAYVAGWTSSSDFPVTAGAVQTVYGGANDGFVLKLNAAGNALSYASYLGGNGSDAAYAIAIDATGNAYVAGSTASANFPVTATAYQKTYGLAKDAFVSKLNPAGSQLVYSTFLGGSAEDVAYGLAVNSLGTAFVTGYTLSPNFPTTAGAAQTATGGSYDAFVTALNPAGAALTYSTYLGGSSDDYGTAIAVDASGGAVAAGYTASSNFPHTAGVVQPAKAAGSNYDAFVSKLNPAGTALSFSTFLGGTGDDYGLSVALDAAGMVYVAGDTASPDFPQSPDAAQPVYTGAEFTSFLSILTPTGAALNYSTYYGGGMHETAYGVAWTASGIFLAGYTTSSDFPVTGGVLQPALAGSEDAFVARFTVCSYAIGAPSVAMPATAGTGSVALTTSANCPWVVSGNSAWATIASAPSGTGSATVNFTVAANTAQAGRWAALTIAGQTFSITQAGTTTQAPTADSVAPTSGSGSLQSFTFAYSDASGYADIQTIYGLFNSNLSAANACFFYYNQPANALYLYDDAGSTALGPLTAGSTATLQNSQCTLNGTGSSITGSGNTLSVVVSLNFTPAFSGIRNIYMYAANLGGLSSGFQLRGSWNGTAPVNVPPTADSVAPSSGSGAGQSFTISSSDGNGYADIQLVSALINSSVSAAGGCYLYYYKPTNAFYLFNDAGSASLGPLAVGSIGTLQNSQCTLNGTGSSISGSGNTLRVVAALTFAPAFTGPKNIYLYAFDAGGLSTGWQNRGTWTGTPAPGNVAPSPDLVTPNSGAGASQSFSFAYSDVNGYADIQGAYALVNTVLSPANGCYVYYSKTANSFYLFDDAAATTQSVAVGSSAIAQNSQCTLNGTGSSISGSGNALTMVLSLSFKPAAHGPKGIFMFVFGAGGLSNGFQNRGSWDVTGAGSNTPPSADSVTPSSGTGAAQKFTFAFSDVNGSADIQTASAILNSKNSSVNACSLSYSKTANSLYLLDDAGVTPQPVAIGSGSAQNSQCILDGAGSSVVPGSGNILTVAFSLTFKTAFRGPKNIYANVSNAGGLSSGWQSIGSWDGSAGGPTVAPTADSVTPVSGSGLSQSFSFVYTDASGYADINAAYALFQSSAVNVANGCYVSYSKAANTLNLYSDSGTTTQSLLAGSSGTAQNSQCTLNGTGSSVTGSGNTLTMVLSLTFQPAFAGARNIYMSVENLAALSSGWQNRGGWNVPAMAFSAAPTADSVTPNAGFGLNQSFSFTYSDVNGYTDIQNAYAFVNANLFGLANGCFAYYSKTANAFLLDDDSGTTTQSVTVGSSATAQNSQCILNGTGSSISGSGNTLTVTLSLTFKPAFAGTKNIYLWASSVTGYSSGWRYGGSWTVTAANLTAPPTADSATPNSGSGASQSFSFVYSDVNGFADIQTAQVIFNLTPTATNGCYVYYSRFTNSFYLFDDSGATTQAVAAGSNATAQNSQCMLNGTGSSLSGSGNTQTMVLALSFKPAFMGAKSIYMYGSNVAGSGSGWQYRGSWNPAAAPTADSVNPNSGTGSNQNFSFAYSDGNGSGDIQAAYILISPSLLTATNTCYVFYSKSANTLYLYDDMLSIAQPVPVGSTATAQNSQCILNGTGSSASGSGNTLTVVLSLSFKAAFTGPKNIYMYVSDNENLSSGWQYRGSWTAP